ncbi:hypothetical protein THIOM_005127 [Candidatus Thiomargarita nelsonii]|uniref:Uncharacterized protein n=1 Tax=Candidatus Thiomargarita nelsonii TaxID=1003181 RepID=A0A176RU41_9GAMM|nr:hypothetical protein THIOM_005127 [Candidatus Thiomargarita nelsonii]
MRKTKPNFEQEIQKTTEKYLSELKAQDEEKFNRQLKEQLNDIITAITNRLPQDKDQDDIQQTIQKYIKTFWLRYKKTEGPKPDYVAKRLTAEFKDYFVSLTQSDTAQKHYSQDIKPTDKEIIALNQIADMFLETKDQKGKDIILQIEFEAEYNTDKEMDRRILHYESFVDFDQQRIHARNKHQAERELFTQVFYLRRSPKSGSKKPKIEHVARTVTTPTLPVPKLLKYTAYHVYQFDIVDILQTNLPFLFCFVGNMVKVTPDKIQQHESEIRQMIYVSLTENQRQLMKTVLANFKQKGYYDVKKSDNIDIIQQMIEVTEMYRGNEELVRAESLQRGLQRGLQQGEEITSLKWFLRGRLEFTDLAEELGEQKALLVQQNAENFRSAMEKGTPLAKLLEQLDEKR